MLECLFVHSLEPCFLSCFSSSFFFKLEESIHDYQIILTDLNDHASQKKGMIQSCYVTLKP